MDESRDGIDFTRLSRQYAEGGDLRRAALAAWAADVHALERLLWDNGLDLAPEPCEQLATVGSSIAEALDALATQSRTPTSLRAVVETARAAMIETFDESVHGLLTDSLADLSHLDLARVRPAAAGRLQGRTADELVDELRTAAADCAAVAQLLDAEGEHEVASRLADQADSASFEAYLVQAAVRAGDHDLATVDLRWDLAAERSGRTGLVRDDLVAILGSAEQEQLRSVMEQSR